MIDGNGTTDVLDTVIGGVADTGAAESCRSRARELEEQGDRAGVIEALRGAVAAGGGTQDTFRLAYLLDLVGEEDEAVGFYEALADLERPPVSVILNLAVIYEDRADYVRAEKCLRQILDTNPNHKRARLFMKDVQASKDMFYDESHVRDLMKRNALLNTPVTDFELSVRARNCLRKIQIRTLGDLLKITEPELLSYKNFGDTSLAEIKAMLASKGLHLGEDIEGRYSQVRKDFYEQLAGVASESVLNRSISQLDLSVRSRKALQMLGIQTIGDLATRTEAELLGVKNFGATSLDEVRERLTQFGLDLRQID